MVHQGQRRANNDGQTSAFGENTESVCYLAFDKIKDTITQMIINIKFLYAFFTSSITTAAFGPSVVKDGYDVVKALSDTNDIVLQQRGQLVELRIQLTDSQDVVKQLRDLAALHRQELEKAEAYKATVEAREKALQEKKDMETNAAIDSIIPPSVAAAVTAQEALAAHFRDRSATDNDTRIAGMLRSGLVRGCAFHYTKGTTPGAKVMHVRPDCGNFAKTLPENRSAARPCSFCFEPLLPLQVQAGPNAS